MTQRRTSDSDRRRCQRCWQRPLLLALAVCLLLAPAAAAADSPVEARVLDYNLVGNFGFETFVYVGSKMYVADGWTAFVTSGSPEFWQGTKLFTVPEHVEGNDSQVIRGQGLFEAGLYQVVTGLTTGVNYSVLGYVLSIFETSAHANPDAFDGLIYKRIGVDPYGGIDPRSANVVWGPLVGENADSATWGQRFTFMAQQSTATVFIRIECLQAVSNSSYHNDIFIDAVQIRRSPVAQVTVPTDSDDDYPPSGPFTVKWSAAVPSPSAGTAVIEYDVQYRDGTGEWQDWLSHTTATGATFERAEPGHSYTFRARAWAKYGYPGKTTNPYAEMFGPWAESAAVSIGQSLLLTVYDNQGNTVANMPAVLRDSDSRVVASGITDGSGAVYLAPGNVGNYDVIVSPFWYLAPEPVRGASIGEGIEPVGMTVRPPDDAVLDGSFEGGTEGIAPSGWTVIGADATVSEFARHGGTKSLRLYSLANNENDVCVRQEFSLSDVYAPALAFWYRVMPGPSGMAKMFTATVADGNGEALASGQYQAQADSGWLVAALVFAGVDTTYTGPVTAEFCISSPGADSGTVSVYIDDVSLGRGAGGDHVFFLPLVHHASEDD